MNRIGHRFLPLSQSLQDSQKQLWRNLPNQLAWRPWEAILSQLPCRSLCMEFATQLKHHWAMDCPTSQAVPAPGNPCLLAAKFVFVKHFRCSRSLSWESGCTWQARPEPHRECLRPRPEPATSYGGSGATWAKLSGGPMEVLGS